MPEKRESRGNKCKNRSIYFQRTPYQIINRADNQQTQIQFANLNDLALNPDKSKNECAVNVPTGNVV